MCKGKCLYCLGNCVWNLTFLLLPSTWAEEYATEVNKAPPFMSLKKIIGWRYPACIKAALNLFCPNKCNITRMPSK